MRDGAAAPPGTLPVSGGVGVAGPDPPPGRGCPGRSFRGCGGAAPAGAGPVPRRPLASRSSSLPAPGGGGGGGLAEPGVP